MCVHLLHASHGVVSRETQQDLAQQLPKHEIMVIVGAALCVHLVQLVRHAEIALCSASQLIVQVHFRLFAVRVQPERRPPELRT